LDASSAGAAAVDASLVLVLHAIGAGGASRARSAAVDASLGLVLCAVGAGTTNPHPVAKGGVGVNEKLGGNFGKKQHDDCKWLECSRPMAGCGVSASPTARAVRTACFAEQMEQKKQLLLAFSKKNYPPAFHSLGELLEGNTHPVPGSPGPEPAGELATARPSSHPGLWDTNGMGVAGVPDLLASCLSVVRHVACRRRKKHSERVPI
jgi:hypothetical protein